jgi:ferrochelatase
MKGVLLVNLGSPESPTAKDVKPYLDEFLMDKYVIDVPYLLRALLVRGIILRKRPEKSAEAYAKIWTPEGSPLIVISKKMHKKVQALTDIPVSLAMRYGTMTILKGLQELSDKGVNEVMLFPLYPQHAMASTTTILVLAEELRAKHFPDMSFTIVPAFYNKPDYSKALANSIQKHLASYNYDHSRKTYSQDRCYKIALQNRRFLLQHTLACTRILLSPSVLRNHKASGKITRNSRRKI